MSPFARVAVPRPLFRTFLYRIPEGLVSQVLPGSRVVIRFGRRELTGWVDEIVSDPDDMPTNVREILDAPDAQPVLDAELLELCRWVAAYYVAPLGLTFRAALPAGLTSESSERLTRRESAGEASVTPAERTLLAHLNQHSGPLKLGSVRKALGPGPWAGTARRLAERGMIEIVHDAPAVAPPLRVRQVVRLTRQLASLRERDRVFDRAQRQRELYEYLESAGGDAEIAHLGRQLGISRSVVHGLVKKELAEISEDTTDPDPFAETPTPATNSHTPTPAQASAISSLLLAAEQRPPGTFVLKGVTGSGKTLVYIEILRELVSRRGRGAILLVPEISLTPQTVGRFRAAFGNDVAVLHSALSEGERYAAWNALRTGEKRIVIGARSAVFAPVQKLGAIIIDEEHEGSYKQSDPAPRYHAREVAVVRARQANALCLLGSATPSLEAWSNARSGSWLLLELPERIGQRPLPTVRVLDLRQERLERANGQSRALPVLSTALRSAIQQRLDRGEQTILLLNRRGYSTFVQCRDCGTLCGCPRCNVSLTHHRRPPRLICHHCYHQEPVPGSCPDCGSLRLAQRGMGTEQVERVLDEVFPSARFARMDMDTTSAKWSHHEILGRFERGEVDILFGTQMIAKGLDFPAVTLVGVINADVGLSLPDFRASERTFQLLTQV
ncbi:MAG: primosomal protein N', partial [Gemmatimonadota bacterium]